MSKQSKLTKIYEDDKEFLNETVQDQDEQLDDPMQYETQDLRKRKNPKKQTEEPFFNLVDQQQK